MITVQMRKKGSEMARLSEQEVNAALELLNRLAYIGQFGLEAKGEIGHPVEALTPLT
jgi:hypothetical protein